MPSRRLNRRQQRLAAEATVYIAPSINAFRKRNQDLRPWIRRVDMQSVAELAVCQAAFTFNPKRSKATTYFSTAIRHALYRAVLRQQRDDRRYIPVEAIRDPQPLGHRIRQEMKALKALRLLSPAERTLLEDRLIEGVTLDQLARELGCDPRTVSKRVRQAIASLQAAVMSRP